MPTQSMFVPDSVPPAKLDLMLRRATMEGKAAAADICSVRLQNWLTMPQTPDLVPLKLWSLSAKKPQPLRAKAVQHGTE
jgi:hypothetical protein